MGEDQFDFEDEDVVIEGSALHEHLSKFGYTNFETMTVQKSELKKEKESNFKFPDFISHVKTILRKTFSIYSWIIGEEKISKEQLTSILDAKVLLQDHAVTIQSLLNKFPCKSWRVLLQEFILMGVIIVPPVYISCTTSHNFSTRVFASSTLLLSSYLKYSRLYAHRNLGRMVFLQNDLLDLCTKGLKILRHGYRIKLSKSKPSQKFYDLTADRLKYLPPLMENLVNSMEQIAQIYYKCSLVLVKLLPANVLKEDALTVFESESFTVRGEINYQNLKKMYYTYILVQSEMLHLLAIAYDSEVWKQSFSTVPERQLSYMILVLIGHLTKCKNNLSKVIDAYYSFKVKPISHQFNGSIASKWQDLYVHLHLTSNKLQLAYSHILSIVQDIDNSMNISTANTDSVETVMQKLNEAYKEIDAARNFIEFSSLLIAKTRFDGRSNKRVDVSTVVPEQESELPVILDSEPQIEDEVFEEYIKEEYLKPLYEENDEVSLENYKWDKFFAKSFMCELKEALVDKQKSMSERESKALQRMYKNVVKETDSKVNDHVIPPPPPMPNFDFNEPSVKIRSPLRENGGEVEVLRPTAAPRTKNIGRWREEEFNESDDEPCVVPFIPVPAARPERPNAFGLPANHFFFQYEEETFAGDGEKSEEEFSEDEKEEEEAEEHDRKS